MEDGEEREEGDPKIRMKMGLLPHEEPEGRSFGWVDGCSYCTKADPGPSTTVLL
jgi:hypothetical protein